MENILPQLVTEKAAAEALAVSIAALRLWRREGRGPRFVHVERCVRYDVRDLTNYLNQKYAAVGNNPNGEAE